LSFVGKASDKKLERKKSITIYFCEHMPMVSRECEQFSCNVPLVKRDRRLRRMYFEGVVIVLLLRT
jgi:hypothetical protein